MTQKSISEYQFRLIDIMALNIVFFRVTILLRQVPGKFVAQQSSFL